MALWKVFGIIQRIIAIFNYNMTNLSLCLVIVYMVTVTRENTPLLHLLTHVHFPVKQFSWILRLLCNFSFQSVSVRMRCRDSLTKNPERLGEEVINALHPILRQLNVDATLAEEDSRTYSWKGEGSMWSSKPGSNCTPIQIVNGLTGLSFHAESPPPFSPFFKHEIVLFKGNAFGWQTCEMERHA